VAVTDLIRGRQTATRTLTNKSGGGVVQGDVVVIGDGATDNAFTTTTTASFNARAVGVVMETIASNAAGLVAVGGWVPKVKTNAAVTRDHYLFSHTVAKQATGAFGQALASSADPPAVIWPLPEGTAASGAPTGAKYLVGALDAGLSNEKVLRHFHDNYDPDNYPTSGTDASTDEFDDSSLHADWTWTTAPGGTVSESQFPGYLHIDGGTDASATTRFLRRAYVPGATAFSVASKMALTMNNANVSSGIGICLLDAADAVIWSNEIFTDGTATAGDGFRITTTNTSGGYTATALGGYMSPFVYLLITRDAANVYNGYFSLNGVTWNFLGTSTVATAVTKVAIRYGVDTDLINEEGLIDFVRVFSSVTRKIGA
jgi:hypothetical protein